MPALQRNEVLVLMPMETLWLVWAYFVKTKKQTGLSDVRMA